ncbi:conserved hypothetical protein [uncultured Defluviicoccus sp.]|uniref:Uncharacterized protein n=1 Tax=metagenome TaxID=256318 RepID=A0A380TLC3_9ZZZZ|nr:conserved hypothetical protein [uncultured Defluviicoccus sp.]
MCCAKEAAQQSVHSPGRVADSETVGYALLDPDNWRDGKLLNAAFSRTRLRACDLSIYRVESSTAAMILEKVVSPQLQRNQSRSFAGVLRALCADIRACRDQSTNDRQFCVVDDGLDGFESHALLGFSESTAGASSNLQTAARANLVAVFGGDGSIATNLP